MAQQTAVEWFADEILKAAIVFLYNEKNEGKFSLAYDELLEQAKQMEEEQITDAYNMGSYDMAEKKFEPEQYYNRTYKN